VGGAALADIASEMAKETLTAARAALFAALMVLSGFRTEGAPAAKSLETLVEGLEHLRLKVQGGILSGLTCDVCKAVVDIIDELYSQSKTEDEIVSVLTTFCIDFKIEDRNVCSLVIPEFKVLKDFGIPELHRLCPFHVPYPPLHHTPTQNHTGDRL